MCSNYLQSYVTTIIIIFILVKLKLNVIIKLTYMNIFSKLFI